MRLMKALIAVLLFFAAAVIYPCESRDEHSNHDREPNELSHFTNSYRIKRENLVVWNSSRASVTQNRFQAIIERGKIFSSQLGDWLENVGFLPVTVNIPDVISGAMSWFGGGEGSGSTPRKILKMLSKMYKDITKDSDIKDELKVIEEHASEFETGFKTVWEAIDFSEEFDKLFKYFMK